MKTRNKLSNVMFQWLFVLMLTAALCLSASAAITLDSKASTGLFSGTETLASLTWTHTVTACSNCSFYVAVSTYGTAPAAASRVVSVTVDGLGVPILGTQISPGPIAIGNATAELFSVLGPLAAGDHTVAVTFVPAGVQYGFASSFLFNGVNQTSPNSAFFSAGGNSDTPGLTMVGDQRGSMVLNVLSSTPAAGFMVEGPGQIVCENTLVETTCSRGRGIFNTAFDIGAVGRRAAVGTGTAISWTMSTADQWALGAVAIQPDQIPTAGGVSISGQLHGPSGRGVAGATVSAQDMDGGVRTAMANPFGYFEFEDVPAGKTYVISVRSKQYSFQPVIVSPEDNVTGVDLFAVEDETGASTARPR